MYNYKHQPLCTAKVMPISTHRHAVCIMCKYTYIHIYTYTYIQIIYIYIYIYICIYIYIIYIYVYMYVCIRVNPTLSLSGPSRVHFALPHFGPHGRGRGRYPCQLGGHDAEDVRRPHHVDANGSVHRARYAISTNYDFPSFLPLSLIKWFEIGFAQLRLPCITTTNMFYSCGLKIGFTQLLLSMHHYYYYLLFMWG